MKLMRRSKFRGFTLIELLVVILILAILAALIVPKLLGRADDAKRSKAASDIAALETCLRNYRYDCDRYPTTEQGLEALRTDPGDVRNWKGPYTEKSIPPDPWGNAYVYSNNGNDSISVISYGADGTEGGDGNNADIGADEGS